MTADEFDNLKLPIKLTFKESESVRVVLVHGFKVEQASECYGVDRVRILELLEIINANKNI